MHDLDDEGKAKVELLNDELTNQSDRGVAIIGGAWVEEELSATLQGTLLADAKAFKAMFGRSSSFFAKIELARLLGLIAPEIQADLHVVRGIRNDFAHDISAPMRSALSFETESIKQKCLAFNLHNHEFKSARRAYISACIKLTQDFYVQRLFSWQITEGTFGLIHVGGMKRPKDNQ